jgi:hypothetical protein
MEYGRSNSADQGKSVTATIVNSCGGCSGEFDLILSRSAFSVLADPTVGVIPVRWIEA